jgi:hypothetical protein
MITEPVAVTMLYTAALGGRLALLPYLMTRIRQERTDQTGLILLVDLGKSCTADAWICQATNNRGMLVAMDAMGYDAFHIGAADTLYTQPGIVQQLRDVLQTPLAAGPWSGIMQRRGLTFSFAARLDVRANQPVDLICALQLGKYARADVDYDGQSRLLSLDGGWLNDEPLLGRLDLLLSHEPPYIEVTGQSQIEIRDDVAPDPTMMSVIEFVEHEARVAERKRGSLD